MADDSNKRLQEVINKQNKTIASLSKRVEILANADSVNTLKEQLDAKSVALEKANLAAEKTSVELENDKSFMRSTMNSLSTGIITTDLSGSIFYINPAGRKILNLKKGASRHKTIDEIFRIETNESILIDLIPTQKKLAPLRNQLAFFSNDRGLKCTFEWSRSFIINKAEEPIGLVFFFDDITHAHNLKQQLKHQATHDGLTGLYNRIEFDRRLTNLIGSSHNQNATHALIYIDLDQFKIVNDACGHQAGDELLRQLSSIMSRQVRGRDTLARIGGDEFAVLLEHCPQKVSLKIAQTLLRTIQDFRFTWQEKAFDVGASLGVLYFSLSGITSHNPLSLADVACYKAKELGRNRIHEVSFFANKTVNNEPLDEKEWVVEINNAITEKRLVLYQQTIAPIDLTSSEKANYEILIRILDTNGNLIPPGAFLPAAERFNIINSIDRYVIRTTFHWLAEHPDILAATKQCSINLSGPSLSDPGLPNFVSYCFEQYNIPFEKICFEITETSVIQHLNIAKKFMMELQDQGCIFALDDFGTGMSSFSYLKQLPVNKLKIDGTFVRDIAKDPIDLALIRSINDIGHVMGMQTIAEFVEGPEILQLLKEIGVDYVQGYYIAKPEPIESLIKHLQ